MGPLNFMCNDSSNHEYNHLDNISGIRTRAIEIVNVFEMEFRWEKDMDFFLLIKNDVLGTLNQIPKTLYENNSSWQIRITYKLLLVIK